uniref:Reverse transcriptase domain-containing protein n=1 Tax=Tanacetum cinerariifolium TaxID=118510 RepID=A0A6L2MNV9_TANCI|nr:hypothetical protein [Tanacetum cinerariifolium]
MGDEYLSTIPETESDEVIKSSVKNFVPIPSESEEFSGELAHIDFVPPRINKADFDPEEEIRCNAPLRKEDEFDFKVIDTRGAENYAADNCNALLRKEDVMS